MNEDTYRDKLTDLQVEIEELRAKLAQSTMGQLNDMAQSTKAGDTISRQAALTALASIAGVGNRALDKIRALPSAQPEPKWIPCSEMLPEVHESGNSFSGIYMQSNPVLVYGTCEYEDNAQFHVVTYCDDLDGNTYWSTELDAITVSGVIAWMPLPEPYMERRTDETQV